MVSDRALMGSVLFLLLARSHVEEMITGLKAVGKNELIPLGFAFASLFAAQATQILSVKIKRARKQKTRNK